MKQLLDIGNGKFLATVVLTLGIYVTWYTQTASFEMGRQITDLETRMKIKDSQLQSAITNINTQRKRDYEEVRFAAKEIADDLRGIDVKIIKFEIMDQVQSAYDVEQGTRESLMIEVLNKYQAKNNGH